MSAHLIVDLYPCELTLARLSPETGEPTAIRYPRVRCVLTERFVTVWHQPPGHLPEVLLRAPVKEWSHDPAGGRRAPWRVATDEAEPQVLELVRSSGCGCGSHLKRLDVRWAIQDQPVPV